MKISVITPSFNQGRFIERTICSVLSQGTEIEYLVMDGGSTDETVNILKKYEDRLRWVSEPDRGQTDALNKGIRKSRGEIIGWLNSDDIYFPGAVPRVIRYFDTHPDVDVVYGDAYHIDETDNIIEPYYTEDWDYERLKEICFICQPALFFRRKVIDRFGLPDDGLQYCMDYEYWLRIGEKIPFTRIDGFLAGSRLYQDNKTLGSRVAVHREINDMLKKKIGYVPAKWIYGFAHAVVNQRGYDRKRKKDEFRYLCELLFHTIRGFITWKRKITPVDLRTMAGWGAAALKTVIPRD